MSGKLTTVLLLCAFTTAALAMGGRPADDEEAINQRIQPLARVALGSAIPAAAPGSRTGEALYKTSCASCHDTGAAGAPKVGDTAAWAPRIALKLDGLVKSATAGKNAMPPKGGVADITSDEMARVIAFIANQSGAKFTAPEAPKTAAAK